jgi:exportin-5
MSIFVLLVLNHLTTRWQYITELYESGTLNDDSNDTQEVIEDMLNRTLSREYLDVLKVALVGGTCSDSTGASGGDGGGGGGMDLEDQSMDGTPHTLTRAAQSAMAAEVISELGGKLLRYPYTCTSIVMTVLSGLAWNDSNCSLKSTCLTGPIVRFLAAEQLLTASLASNVLIAVLQGLQLHGQHEANQVSVDRQN